MGLISARRVSATVGPIGPKGDPGPQGGQGPAGSTGPQGLPGAGAPTVTAAAFSQPAVWTPSSPVITLVQFATTDSAQAGGGCIIGANYYLVSSVLDGTHAYLLNTGASGNVSPGTSIPVGSTAVFSGIGAPLAATAPTPGVAQVFTAAGNYAPVGVKTVTSVSQYGAKGDNATDDWASIQLALDSIPVGSSAPQDVYLGLGSVQTTISGDTRYWYRIKQPLALLGGNGANVFCGAGETRVGIANVASDYTGPAVIVGIVDQLPTYVNYTTGGANIWGIRTSHAAPRYLNLSTYDTGSIHGFTNFACLYQFNPESNAAPINSTECLAESYGTVNGGVYSAFSLRRVGNGTSVSITAALTFLMDNGAVSTFTASTSGTDVTANYANLIEVRWNGTNLYLSLNGTIQATVPTTTGGHNAVSVYQSDFEEYYLGTGGPASYPSTAPGPIQGSQGVIMRFGIFNSTGASTNFSYNPATFFYTPNINCTFFVDWGPTSQPANALAPNPRASYGDFIVAQSAVGNGRSYHATGHRRGNNRGDDVWLNTYVSQQNYVSDAMIRDMGFSGLGTALYFWSALSNRVENVTINGYERGIVFEGYSYDNNIRGDVIFGRGVGGKFVGANILTLSGSQFTRIGPGVVSGFGTPNWHFMHTFGDATVEGGFPNGVRLGVYGAFGNATALSLFGASYTDEGAAMGLCGVYLSAVPQAFNPALSFQWHGGTIFHLQSPSTVPHFIFGGGVADLQIHADISPTGTSVNAPLFSFQAVGGEQPAVTWGFVASSGVTNVIDQSHKGIVRRPNAVTTTIALSMSCVLHGNTTITSLPDLRGSVAPGSTVMFPSDATTYTVATVGPSSITLTAATAGSSATTMAITKLVLPLVNFAFSEYCFTELGSAPLTAGCTIVYPVLLSGYAPRFVNSTSQTLTIGGANGGATSYSGSPVTLASGKTQWIGADPSNTNFIPKSQAA